MKRQEFKMTGGRPVIYEEFASLDEFLRVLQERESTGTPIDYNIRGTVREDFAGVATFETAEEFARNGYTEPLEEIKSTYEVALRNKSVNRITPAVTGGAPIVPNAIRGLPRSMLGIKRETIAVKAPVVDLCIDATVSCRVEPWQIKGMALKVVSDIAELESSGYRVNLYSVAAFCDWQGRKPCEAVAVKIKDCNQKFSALRIAFALMHPAMLRCLMFQWYNYVPGGVSHSGFGKAIFNKYGADETPRIGKEIFGHSKGNVAYVPIAPLIKSWASQHEVHGAIQKALAG